MSKATIHISGIIGTDTSLLDVIRQYKSFENVSEVEAIIDSVGGSVEQGEAIYDYLKALDIPVTTVAKKAYSIAASIFMAGDEGKRIVEDREKVLMLHMPLVQNFTGNREKLQFVADELGKLEKKFTDFYAKYLDIPKETIEDLLHKTTYLNALDAVALGFATEIKDVQLQAVAMLTDNKPNINMTNKKDSKEALAIELQDANGDTYNFPDTEEKPAVGDKVQDADGNSVKDKEIVMPDGSAIVTDEMGKISEIKPAEEEKEAEPTEEPVAEVVKQVMKWEIEIDNTSFEEGDILKYTYEDTEYSVGAGEYELEDGKRVVTDADGKIVKVIEAETKEETEPTETEAQPEAIKIEMIEKVIAQATAPLTEQNKKLEAEIIALKKSIGSSDVNISATENQNNKNRNNKNKSYLRN